MEYVVNEAGCRAMIGEMDKKIKDVTAVVNDILSEDRNLRDALGSDYDYIGNSMKKAASTLEDAQGNLSVIREKSEEYMARVQEVHVILG